MESNFIEGLRKYWVLLAFVGGLIISWTDHNSRITALEKADIKHEQQITANSDKTAQLIEAIIEIKANYIFIKEKLEKQ